MEREEGGGDSEGWKVTLSARVRVLFSGAGRRARERVRENDMGIE